MREYIYFEKISLFFIPLAFSNIIFGDLSAGLTGGFIWTLIWFFVKKHNVKVRQNKKLEE